LDAFVSPKYIAYMVNSFQYSGFYKDFKQNFIRFWLEFCVSNILFYVSLMKRSLELFFGVMGSVYEGDKTFVTMVVEERCAERRMEELSK
jgi:hypothetical protein